jgi:hypothetical protein
MKYPFLRHNKLILIDYIAGSSGQLLLRLWSELDARMAYDNPDIMSEYQLSQHPASLEISYDILVPKLLVNWIVGRCKISTNDEYLLFLEMLATYLFACRKTWEKVSQKMKFQETDDTIKDERIIYGIHSYKMELPIKKLNKKGYDIRLIRIVPRTLRGRKYQISRMVACYPFVDQLDLSEKLKKWNNKSRADEFDLCTLLVDKNSEEILCWFKQQLGADFRSDKITRFHEILNTYYKLVIDQLDH